MSHRLTEIVSHTSGHPRPLPIGLLLLLEENAIQEENAVLSPLPGTAWPRSAGRASVPLGFRSGPDGRCRHFTFAGSTLGGPSDRGKLVPLAVPQLSFSATWTLCSSVHSLGPAVRHRRKARRGHRDLAEEERGVSMGIILHWCVHSTPRP